MVKTTFTLKLYGLINDPIFHMGKAILDDIAMKYTKDVELKVSVEGMLEFEWKQFIDKVVLDKKGEMWMFDETAVFFNGEEVIGGIKSFEKFVEKEFQYINYRPLVLYEAMAEEAYKSFFESKNRDIVYFDILVQDETIGRLLIELLNEHCPQTCLNFKLLCTGERGRSEETGLKLHYLNSIIHRVVKNGWVQGGDIDLGKGNGGCSVFGLQFEDESFAVPHDRRGIVGMANHGRHSNRSQFYITFQSTPWMDRKYVAFGRVIEGYDVLKKLEALETFNERPKKDTIIQSCGVFYNSKSDSGQAEVEAGEIEPVDYNKMVDDAVEQVTENVSNFII